MAETDLAAAPKVGTNIDRPVIDLYRPHITSGDCLIVTGYQDFLSSLAVLMKEVKELKDPDTDPDIRIRISFGIDTGNSRRLAKPRPVTEEMKLYWLEKSGLQVEDDDDLLAVLAKRAIQTRKIELRVFDPVLAQSRLGINGDRRMHSKIVSSPIGAVAGSANFSRSGLYSNIEYADGLDAGTHELQLERTSAAEQIWDVSTDWTAEALEILDKLIKPATAEDATARMIAEQKGFEPWLTGSRQEITGHTLYDYQQELTYEACSITYDNGIAFVEAPTGSGKTEIGCHLAEALSETFSRVIPRSPVHGVARKNAAVIAPPKVIPSWEKHSTNSLEAIPNTSLSKKRLRGAGDDNETGLRLDQFGILIIDESHTVTPGFEQASQMAAAVELAPPSWNVCLSATLLGNRDVDWLTHMQEKRASIFMTPNYIQAMGELFDREMQSSPDIFDQKAPLAVLSEPETALSRQARTELSELISPFLARRQRRCIGEDEDRSKHGYPKLANHGRPKTLKLTKPQRARLDEILALCNDLAPGGRVTAVEKSRFGHVKTQQSTQDQLHIRNLLNILRVNAAQAAWEMSHGVIGKWLREFEQGSKKGRRAPHPGQSDMFGLLGVDALAAPEKCDALAQKLNSRSLREVDEKRYEACHRIQQQMDRVVFLAERTDTLEIFAEALSRRGHHTNFVVGNQTKGDERAVKAIFGNGPDGFRRITHGKSVESYFRPGGRNAPEGPASVFLTYKMAEGINLQSADTLVLLGVTSNLKELIQGLGRIDRIDSQFGVVNYHLVDIPVGQFASDEKVTNRIENYRTLAGEELIDAVQEDGSDDTEVILESVTRYLGSARRLRDNNFHDVLARTKETISPERYRLIRKAKIEGTWGAELALLSARESFTALHLKGVDKPTNFFPPRLLLLHASETGLTLERGQLACAKTLDSAYERTRSLGMEQTRMTEEDLASALETVSGQLGVLTEWDLRPARVESLMKACAEFMSRRGDKNHDDRELFGHLSLPAIEMICESWSRLLDPFWEQAKQEVRDSFAYEDLPKGYIAIQAILQKLENDVRHADEVHQKMSKVIEEAELLSRDHEPEIGRRVSVVFFSTGAGEH
ncbi:MULTISPECIES: DEAD/DEAH box helicase family protein [Roseobacteraceae]|uniref:Type III restriction enzyme, res subunit n=1 Tax=Pseudosulfitobacter pseudonitzschiae TaxID=1402135 RepID=A0A221K786_9RHOB|nr:MULTISPECIES: DEAD/DEAH box helicase family protein [Roseobacteraceae]ASM74861.1 type III restriction enzyme, res subunit [Pseudosulfitobacter pseudonitzschiae]